MAADNGSILLYRNDGSTVSYALRSISYRLEPSGVAVATYNTPKSLHSLSPNLHTEMHLILQHARRDDNVKVLVWTASGDRAFCSGAALRGDMTVHCPADILKEYAERNQAPHPTDIALKNLTLAFWDFPKPSIAAINGLAVGGGVNIALANYHDMVICSTKARFKYPFVQLGLTPELGSSRMMPFLVGMAKAKEMMMLGEWFTAEDALRLQLVNAVHSPEALMPETMKVAEKLAGWPNQTALRLAKKVMNSHIRNELERVMDVENTTILQALKAMGGNPLSTMGANSKAKL